MKKINILLSICILLGFFACNSTISENEDEGQVKVKRNEIANLIGQYKEYGIEPLELSEQKVREADLGELKEHLEMAKRSYELNEIRKNSFESKLTNQYAQKIIATESEEDKRLLLKELEYQIVEHRALINKKLSQ